MEISTVCEMSHCEWIDIERRITELTQYNDDQAKQITNIKRLVYLQIQCAFNEGVDKGKLGLVT